MNKSNLLTFVTTKKYWLWLLLILFLTFLVYLPILQNGFLKTWDDNRYVLENPYIQKINPEAIGKMFTVFYDGHYHPLTLFSLALDHHFGGLTPEIYHVHSLILHLVNTLLVFVFLQLLFRKKSRFIPLVTAFLFGISTTHIETVAWVSERKNLLFALFFFASLISYIRFIETEKKWLYLTSLLLFLLSILSKSSAISLAVTIVLIDLFFRREVFSRRVILEKIPFFLLAIIFGVVAVMAQKTTWGEDFSQVQYSFAGRILFSGYAYIVYIVKLIFPYRMSGFYPYPTESTSVMTAVYILFTLLSIINVVAAIYFFRQSRISTFGVLFFSINIFLLLKMFEVPAGDYIMADRYAYVPSVGILLILARGFDALTRRKLLIKYMGRAILIIYSLFIMLQTFNRVPVWEDDISFFSDIILKYPDTEMAYTNRGAVRKENHELKGALSDFNKALETGDKDYKAWSNRGAVYIDLGDYSNALADYQQAIRLKPGHPQILADYGFAQMQTGDLQGAFESFNKALELKSFNPDVYVNRGTLRYKAGDYAGAIEDYSTASKQDPENVNACFNRGLARLMSKDLQGAIDDFLSAIKLDPSHEQAWSNMGVAWSRLNDLSKAMECYDKAISLQPDYFEAWLNRGIDKYYAGDFSGSLTDLNRTIELNNGMAPAYYFRAMANLKSGNQQVCDDLEKALSLGFQAASEAIQTYCK
jgi:tetratricopeptide (TPR) repeat protein